MSISKAYINGSASALAEFLDGSGLFGSVTESSGTITCKDSDDNTVCVLSEISNTGRSFSITAYYNNGESSMTNNWTYDYDLVSYAYKCNNGIILDIIQSGGSSYACLLITKTNNGKLCFVFSSQSGSGTGKYTTFYSIAYDDVAPISSTTLSPNEWNQTSVTSFLSNNDLNVSSYTPDAGFVLFGQNYSMGYGSLTMDGEIWLTNGYWAIRDGAAS